MEASLFSALNGSKNFATDALHFLSSIAPKGGGVFDYFIDKDINKVSIYAENSLAAYIWEQAYHSDVTIDKLISDVNRKYSVILPRTGEINFLPLSSFQNFAEKTPVVIVAPYNKTLKKQLCVFGTDIYYINELLRYSFYKNLLIKQLEDFNRNNPTVKIVFCNAPRVNDIKNKSNYETFLLNEKPKQTSAKVFEMAYKSYGFDQEYMNECLQKRKGLYVKNGISFRSDCRSKYVNIINGHRVTTDCPEHAKNIIWMFGNSTTYGHGVDDCNTISSCLQRRINTYFNGKSPYSVLNCSNTGGRNCYDVLKFFNYIQSNISANDIIVFTFHLNDLILEICENKYSYLACNTMPNFQRPHNLGEIFIDTHHLNATGYDEVARALFITLEQNNAFSNINIKSISPKLQEQKPVSVTSVTFSSDEEIQLSDYIMSIKALSSINYTGKSGSIVMNCNPFTLGHRYLIEYAARQVEHLFIFVVEEDKSIFPFGDRITLVRNGTSDLPNVTVVPSGKFIISQKTFEAYFLKEENQEFVIDTSQDVTIFAEKIAPALNITKRFAGEEPLDNITRQYNATMKMILPRYGIDFEVIPRKESAGEPISASRVRKLLKEKDFESIKKIVPDTTFVYLMEKFGNEK